MRDQDEQSPEYIEEQIEETRHQLSATLGELQRRLSPGDIFEETLNYLKANNGFGQSVATTVKENPIPICLMGIGLTWMIASGASGPRAQRSLGNPDLSHQSYGSGLEGSYSTSSSPSTSSGKGKVKKKMTDAKSKASNIAESAKSKMQEAKSQLSDATESTREKLSGAADRAQHGGDNMNERYENAKHKGSRLARNMREGYQQRTHQVRHQASTMIEERPLAVVAIGFGIGAALGLMLPSTERENRVMGSTRDRLKDRALEQGHDQLERAREQVESAAEATRDQLKKTAGASAPGTSEDNTSATGAGASGAGASTAGKSGGAASAAAASAAGKSTPQSTQHSTDSPTRQ